MQEYLWPKLYAETSGPTDRRVNVAKPEGILLVAAGGLWALLDRNAFYLIAVLYGVSLTGIGMLTLALFPPLWRKVMDPRVVAHLDGDVTLANIQPGKEAKYLAKFPPPQEHDQQDVQEEEARGAAGVPAPPSDYRAGHRVDVLVTGLHLRPH